MNLKKLISKQQTMFWAMFVGIGIMVVGTVFAVSNGMIPLYVTEQQPLQIAIPIVCLAISLGAVFYSNYRLSQIASINNLKKKTSEYTPLVTMRLSAFLICSIVALVAFVLTHDRFFTYIALAMLLCLRVYRPTDKKLKSELNLNENQLNQLSNLSESN